MNCVATSAPGGYFAVTSAWRFSAYAIASRILALSNGALAVLKPT